MAEACCPNCEEQYRELLERRERHIAALEADNAAYVRELQKSDDYRAGRDAEHLFKMERLERQNRELQERAKAAEAENARLRGKE